jgi:DNA-binding response OmpR family regulator
MLEGGAYPCVIHPVWVLWYNGCRKGYGLSRCMAKILIVDDAPDLTEFLEYALKEEGYELAVATDAQTGLLQAHDFRPDLILLDIMMPVIDGWEMLGRLREFTDAPVIMLTAIDDMAHKVHGLDMGADDYITKPFEIKELKARIRAVLRRVERTSADQFPHLSFDEGRLVVGLSSPTVISQGVEVGLTPVEYKLLLLLARNAGRVLTYEQILGHVWGPGYENSVSNVKVYVRRLRKKIEADPSQPHYIQTRWGVGYYLFG